MPATSPDATRLEKEPAAKQALDKASYRNKGGLIQSLVTWYKVRRHGIEAGTGCVVKRSAEFRVTAGGIVKFGDSVIVQDYAYIQLTKPSPRLLVGNDVVIGRNNIVAVKNLVTIGDYTRIGSDVQIIDHGHGFGRNALIKDQPALLGETHIGRDVWIGVGARILMGVRVGDGAVIGANAVVTHDVPENAVVAGVPARVIKYRE